MSAGALGFVGTILVKLLMSAFNSWLGGRKQKEAGRLEERQKQQEQVDAVQNEWDKIDDSTLDTDGAINSLLKRSEASGAKGSDPTHGTPST